MSISLSFNTKGANWQRVCEVFEKAPLGTRKPEKIRKAFENSAVVCFALDAGNIIGFGRALSDGVSCAVIYDLCLLPEYQSKGIGKLIMNGIMEKLEAQNIILYAVPGKEGFYEKFGFAPMMTAMGRFQEADNMKLTGYLVSE